MQQLKCKKCDFTYQAPITANALYICPKCFAYTGCLCDYGFGPITPCNIFLGEREVAKIEGRITYRLELDALGIHKELSKGYSNLEVYKEAAEIVASFLQ